MVNTETITTTHDVRKARVADVAEFAKKAFKDHTIETLLDHGVYRNFWCSNGGSSIYAFGITTFPGRLVVVGDIGDLIVERCHDMFQWAPGAVNSIEYFEEKVPHCINNFEYDPDIARAWIEEMRYENGWDGRTDKPIEDPERSETLDHLTHHVDEGQEIFGHEVYESKLVDGCDWPDFRVWNGNFLWCREAVRWFFDQRVFRERMTVRWEVGDG